jgi:hypothetical protein
MATTGAPGDTGRQGGQDAPRDPQERAQAPIRWPRPDPATLGFVGVWAVGIFVAVFVPALIVPPNEKHPATGAVWLAFSTTVVGATVMMLTAVGLWRRGRDSSVFVMGAVPAVSCVAGGIILAATKLAG